MISIVTLVLVTCVGFTSKRRPRRVSRELLAGQTWHRRCESGVSVVEGKNRLRTPEPRSTVATIWTPRPTGGSQIARNPASSSASTCIWGQSARHAHDVLKVISSLVFVSRVLRFTQNGSRDTLGCPALSQVPPKMYKQEVWGFSLLHYPDDTRYLLLRRHMGQEFKAPCLTN